MTLSTSDAVRLENNTAIVNIVDDDDGEKPIQYAIIQRGVYCGVQDATK